LAGGFLANLTNEKCEMAISRISNLGSRVNELTNQRLTTVCTNLDHNLDLAGNTIWTNLHQSAVIWTDSGHKSIPSADESHPLIFSVC